MVKLMGLREYARHSGRALIEVQRAIKAGKIEVADHRKSGRRMLPLLDQVKCDANWIENKIRNPKPKTKIKKTTPVAELELETEPEAYTGTDAEKFAKARAKRETYAAKITELTYKKQERELISVDVVREQMVALGTQIQNKLMLIPKRIGSIIAAEYQKKYLEASQKIDEITREHILEIPRSALTDKKTQDIIESEIRAVLIEFKNGVKI